MNRQIRLSDYKLIVFDIDGTIQDSNHNLHPYTRDVLLRLHDANIPFTLATGKNLPAVKPLAETLGITLPLILSNGCMLQTVDGKELEKYVLPVAITHQVIGICEEGGWDLAIYLDDGIYIKRMNHNMALLIDYGSPGLIEIGEWPNIADRLKEAHKCLVVERSSPRKVYELEAVYERELGEKVEYCHTLVGMLEVMPKGVSKLSAIRRLSEMLGISMEEVMTFGDGNNDVEMLEGAGLGITMENGSDLAKASANLTIASSDENGPAKFLDELLERQQQK
ncbi:MAG: Cof-type HAD-IIB family hydrolase [Pelolinea sp.]|nr:Cof-type HAD-IIB family hydrolase [Pelolinea sp.]